GARDERGGARGLHQGGHAQPREEGRAAVGDAGGEDVPQARTEDAQDPGAHDVRAPDEERHAGQQVEERLQFGWVPLKPTLYLQIRAVIARKDAAPWHFCIIGTTGGNAGWGDDAGDRRVVRRDRLWEPALPGEPGPVGDDGPHELREPRPRGLRHGGRLRDRGRDDALGRSFPRDAPARVPRDGGRGRGPRARALSAPLWRERAGPGALLHRPHVHVDRRGYLVLRRLAAAGAPAGVPPGPGDGAGRGPRRLPDLSRRGGGRAHAPPGRAPLAHALRSPGARFRGQCAGRARAGHRRRSRLQRDLRPGLGARGPGRRARDRGARPGLVLPAQVHGVFPPRGGRGRRGDAQRPARGRAPAGRARRGGQVLRPAGGRLRDLRGDGGAADRVSRGPFRKAPVRPVEIAFWLVPVAAFFALPGYLVLGSQILIVSLFALSLDLILGYAGIVSLGHAAFFGVGAYTA